MNTDFLNNGYFDGRYFRSRNWYNSSTDFFINPGIVPIQISNNGENREDYNYIPQLFGDGTKGYKISQRLYLLNTNINTYRALYEGYKPNGTNGSTNRYQQPYSTVEKVSDGVYRFFTSYPTSASNRVSITTTNFSANILTWYRVDSIWDTQNLILNVYDENDELLFTQSAAVSTIYFQNLTNIYFAMLGGEKERYCDNIILDLDNTYITVGNEIVWGKDELNHENKEKIKIVYQRETTQEQSYTIPKSDYYLIITTAGAGCSEPAIIFSENRTPILMQESNISVSNTTRYFKYKLVYLEKNDVITFPEMLTSGNWPSYQAIIYQISGIDMSSASEIYFQSIRDAQLVYNLYEEDMDINKYLLFGACYGRANSTTYIRDDTVLLTEIDCDFKFQNTQTLNSMNSLYYGYGSDLPIIKMFGYDGGGAAITCIKITNNNK